MPHTSLTRPRRRITRAFGIGLLLAGTLSCTAPAGHPAGAAATAIPTASVSTAPVRPPTTPSPRLTTAAASPSVRTTEADRLPGEAPATGIACTPAAVRRTVVRFMAAFNAGDQASLQRLWARTDQAFVWYLDGGQTAQSRAALGAFFAARHAHHEILTLRTFRFTGYGDQGGASFSLTLTRATDGRPAVSGWGKGVVNCTTSPLRLTVLAV